MDLPQQEVSLIVQGGRFEAGQPFQSDPALAFGLLDFPIAESQARKQEVAQNGLARKDGGIKEFHRAGAEAPRFKQAAFVEQDQRLIEVDQPGPDEVFFPDKQRARGEKAQAIETPFPADPGRWPRWPAFWPIRSPYPVSEIADNPHEPSAGLLRSSSAPGRFPRGRDGRAQNDTYRRWTGSAPAWLATSGYCGCIRRGNNAGKQCCNRPG